MLLTSLLYGIFITALGIVGYLATGQASKTALIPCVFGLPIIALALATWFRPRMSKQSLIAALVITLLAFAGTARSFSSLPVLISGGELERPAAIIVQMIMAIASLVYALMAIAELRKKKPS